MIRSNTLSYLFIASIQVLSINAATTGSVTKETFIKNVLSKSKLLRRASSYDDMFTDDSEDHSEYFDISQYSVKFHSCASLSSFDFDDFEHENKDEYHETYPYTSTQVVNYRLCPTDSCQDDSWKGCKNVYGSHVITLEDYFKAKKDYEDDLKESLKKQCEYCEQCENLYYETDEICTYYGLCSNYDRSGCDSNDESNDQGSDDVDYSDFLQCTRVDLNMTIEVQEEMEDNYQEMEEDSEKKEEEREKEDEEDKDAQNVGVYLKVYCDGELKVGIFSDDECSKYIGNQFTIKQLTGLEIEEDDLKNEFDDHDCISCQRNISYEEVETTKMCRSMYDDAAKCHMNIPVDYSSFEEEKEMDEWDETVSGSVCSKIRDIEQGNIDKNGILSSSNFTLSPTMSPVDSNSDPAEEVESSYMGATRYYSSPTNISDYYNEAYYSSSSAGNKSVKDYQTDFVTTINENFMPEGHYITENDVVFVGWAFLVTLVAMSGYCLFQLERDEWEHDNAQSDLMKNEGGFMA